MDKPCEPRLQTIIRGAFKTLGQQIRHSEDQLRLTAEGGPIGAWHASSTSSKTPHPATDNCARHISSQHTLTASTGKQYIADDFASRGFRSLGIAMNTDGQWKLLGLLPVFNPEQQEQGAVEVHLSSSAHALQEGEPMYITIDHVPAPLIGVFVLLTTTAIGSEQVRQGIVGEDGIKPYEVLALFISLIKKLVKWQSTHDDNPPTSKDRDAFLKLQNVYRTRTLQDFAQFKQLVGETCKSASVEGKIAKDKIEALVKHAGHLKPTRGRSKMCCPSTQVFTVSSHHLDRVQPALDSSLASYGSVVPSISSLERTSMRSDIWSRNCIGHEASATTNRRNQSGDNTHSICMLPLRCAVVLSALRSSSAAQRSPLVAVSGRAPETRLGVSDWFR
ncbi:hypothetical protein NDA17_003521 [Ustilago hordei]|nr:hypothetical protein NDA17_003521 [Ustilago hordei]